MRKGKVYCNHILAGEIRELGNGGYQFEYDGLYFNDSQMPAISVTLPKNKTVHESDILFPFFFNMLSEGANRQLQCQLLKIDKDDDFGLLLQTADAESVGAITVTDITSD
jgi:HipA-like protein